VAATMGTNRIGTLELARKCQLQKRARSIVHPCACGTRCSGAAAQACAARAAAAAAAARGVAACTRKQPRLPAAPLCCCRRCHTRRCAPAAARARHTRAPAPPPRASAAARPRTPRFRTRTRCHHHPSPIRCALCERASARAA
jgi:hypothetical protein